MSTISGVVRDVAGDLVSGRTVRLYRRSTGNLIASTTSLTGTEPFDPSYGNVTFSLPLDGANNSTVFTDVGPNALSISRVGTPVISTTQSKFGGASLNTPGGNAYLTTPSTSLLAFGTENFTMEAWVYCGNHLGTILSCRHLSNGLVLRVWSNRLEVFYGGGSGMLTANTTHPINTWFHAAAVREGNTVRLYQNGTQVGTTTWTNIVVNNTPTPNMHIGSFNGSESFVGFIDSCRVTRGVARYSANFTPLEAPFPVITSEPSLGSYEFNTPDAADDYFVICPDNGSTRNDLIIRTKPV